MLSFGRRAKSEATRRNRKYPGGALGWKSEWMVNGDDPNLSPTVFLVEQPANETLPAHFHLNNQFQLFIEGSGRIGARKVGPVTVHYAGAYTGYGPLIAGPEGMKYFTIRTVLEEGAQVIACYEGKVPDGPRRHATSKPIEIKSAAEIAALTTPEIVNAIEPAEDGLASASVCLPAAANLAPMDLGTGEGLFLFVLAGTIIVAGEVLGEWESLYTGADDHFPLIVAGPEGAQVVTMIPPKRDPAYVMPSRAELRLPTPAK